MNRTLVVWCADWPVAAALGEQGLPRHLPAAVFAQNRVQACNQAARDFGIKRGMRRRDAQSRCPEVQVLAADDTRDTRAFEEVLTRLEELRPGVMPLRPGLVALRSPARFYGGETEAGAAIAECVVELGVWDVRIGIADELFTAEQAARSTGLQETYAVPADGGSAVFLRALPVHVLEDANAVSLLQRLGLATLGGLADLPGADVKARFGAQAEWVRRVIHGEGARPVAGRTPPPELTTEVAFEPPLDSAEAVCFSARQTAEGFVKGLAARQEVCTEVRIEVETESAGALQGTAGPASVRTWAHPRWFGAADLIDRLHWQLVGTLRAGDIRSAVTRVRLIPEVAVPEAVHADGLWGGTDQRVERGIARVQGLLGREAVVAPVLQGGRSPRDRQAYVPWGDRPTTLRDRVLPWPGSIPPPAPARVLDDPWPAEVCDQAGRQVVVLPRGGVSGDPARYRPAAGQPWQRVASWAGPWPVTEGWWEPGGGRRVARFQLVGVDGRAWLATFDTDHWLTEASYD
ncbi:MAG: DNA polymerase Y family protein [Nocardioides sp.]|uniref:DNA polymerase Y family protein n=1 Tax=Nocardioides sp. TaxID=35761 RepID=UPI003D6B41C7